MIEACAKLCLESYGPGGQDWYDVDDLRYGVHWHRDSTIIVIRGTANAENWLRDARFWPKKSCGGHLAHGGFVDAFRKLCAGGMPTVKSGNLVVTGHSLGGAVATLLAEHVGCKLITFGSPRVYWRFSWAPQLDHTRVVRDDDPVPCVPAIMYSHRCDPLTLSDGDGQLLQIEDHFMAGYIKALEVQNGFLAEDRGIF